MCYDNSTNINQIIMPNNKNVGIIFHLATNIKNKTPIKPSYKKYSTLNSYIVMCCL